MLLIYAISRSWSIPFGGHFEFFSYWPPGGGGDWPAEPTCSWCFWKFSYIPYHHAKFQKSVTKCTILTYSFPAINCHQNSVTSECYKLINFWIYTAYSWHARRTPFYRKALGLWKTTGWQWDDIMQWTAHGEYVQLKTRSSATAQASAVIITPFKVTRDH